MTAEAWWTRTAPADPDAEAPPELVVDPGPTVVLPAPPPRPRARPRPRPRSRTRPRLRLAPRRRRGPVAAVAAVAGITALAGIGGIVIMRGPGPEPVVAQRAAVTAVPIDPAVVRATASSTQTPDGAITYTAANTLDGDVTTAWNSNGKRDGKGPGIFLTYTFDRPVALQDITVRNGYQKVRPRPGKAPLDLYPVNQRVRRLRVVTDAGAFGWDLTDTRTPQTFTGAAGRTGSVRLEIVSVYPSTAYPDVALSEVTFTTAVDS